MKAYSGKYLCIDVCSRQFLVPALLVLTVLSILYGCDGDGQVQPIENSFWLGKDCILQVVLHK